MHDHELVARISSACMGCRLLNCGTCNYTCAWYYNNTLSGQGVDTPVLLAGLLKYWSVHPLVVASRKLSNIYGFIWQERHLLIYS